ncbi:MAG: 50S ribosomal protein L11 methyltransferase [Parachlamydiaceae bacterium]|nr:50S ribosomal protein L11 methyltransferase [Parachlamydiaceae bacterium]
MQKSKCACFRLKSGTNTDDVWSKLEEIGIQPLYSSEDEIGSPEIYANIPSHIDPHSLQHFTGVNEIIVTPLPEIDWENQWALHGLDFRDGYVHIPVGLQTIRLKPGPGFGDLSHPTTRLMLEMMPSYVHDKNIIDIGSGSGVLSLCAIAMRAVSAEGLEIDPEAMEHAQMNAILNHMQEKVTFSLSKQTYRPIVPAPHTILMNMIQSEQVVAWNSLPSLHHLSGCVCITSGILTPECEAYLKQTEDWGWIHQETKESEGWLAFRFLLR